MINKHVICLIIFSIAANLIVFMNEICEFLHHVTHNCAAVDCNFRESEHLPGHVDHA